MSERIARPSSIAILGMACRFPGGIQDVAGYWDLMRAGRSVIAELPPDRFSIDAVFDPDKAATGLSYSKWGGFLTDIAGFDHGFFEISPREAEAMDPQQRLLLMAAYEAMEDAGLTRAALRQARTGVFVGVSASEYANLQRYRRSQGDAFTGTGAALSIVANRLSHRFNLKGPSFSIDTACSSSLVALDQAIQNLENGHCDIAFVAGAHVLADFGGFVAFSKAGMLSPTGEIATFDARANGYVRGEGIGVVILKRLADARADGNRILARIRATSVNQDGKTPTLTAPDPDAQRAMLDRLCRRAEIDPFAVDYVEAHGTGTPVGDPIEASAIGRVFGGHRRSAPLLMGSVKPNIGHLEPAAGIAGLIKAVLVAGKRQVPPNYGFREPNPDIAFEAHNLLVPTGLAQIGQAGQPVRVVANSFGFGGTNASVLLESPEPMQATPANAAMRIPAAIPISAGSPAALAALAARTAQALHASPAPLDAMASALRARDPKPWRRALMASSVDDLIGGLEDLEAEQDKATKALARPRLAFTYAGQGGQWWAMGRRLLLENAPFAAAFNDFEARFAARAGWSVRETLLADETASQLHRSQFAMPALFGLQYGLSAFWKACGLHAEFVLGHSFGEVAAAVAAGILPLDDAVRLVHVRSQIRERLGRDSAMLVLGVRPDALPELVPASLPIDLAAINSAGMVTVCGEEEDIAAFERHFRETRPDHLVRRVQSDTAWHSHLLDPLEDWFRQALGEIRCQAPERTFVSTVTGEPECRLDADYWWRNLREPVRYAAGIDHALKHGANVLLELSPHRVLTGSNAVIAAETGNSVRAIATLERGKDDFTCLARTAGDLWEAGLAFTWDGPSPAGTERVELPPYDWELTPHWRMSEEARALLLSAPRHHLLGRREQRPGFSWSNEISLAGNAMLADHALGNSVVFPAAGYLELMLAAGREALGDGTLELEDFAILSALFIGPQDDIFLCTHFDPATGQVKIHTRLREAAQSWTLRATGHLRLTDIVPEPVQAALGERRELDAERFYAETARLGFAYGAAFRPISGIEFSGSGARARLALPACATNPVRHYIAHPALLDGALQVGLAFALAGPADERPRLLLPTTIERVTCRSALPPRLIVDARRRARPDTEFCADFALMDEQGNPLLTISGLGMREVPQLDQARPLSGPQFVVEEFIERKDGLVPPEQAAHWLMSGPGVRGRPHHQALGLAEIERRLGQSSTKDEAHIVFVAGPAGPDFDPITAAYENIHALIGLGQMLRNGGHRAHLTVVTRGARDPDGQGIDAAGLAASPIVGLTRTLATELGDMRIRQIDLGAADPLEAFESVPLDSDETEWLVRGDRNWVARLKVLPPEQLPQRTLETTSAAGNFALSMDAPGALGDLHHVSRNLPWPGPGEVLIETAAAGLNFRDVMAATGLLPARAEPVAGWQTLGLEFSGTVRQVGPGVAGIAPGDRVLCMGKSAMQAWSIRPAHSVVPIPRAMDFTQAAGIGSAFATAHYALEHVARIRRGERVLIHLGTGGVGLAAIQIARSRGAEIFSTAGSQAKRQYLRDLGVRHVMNSRSLAFADTVMAVTGGEGVDVVVNSLAGDAQAKGLSLLQPFGRFLEIGKRDIYENRALGLAALARNISFHVIDLAAMNAQRPDLLPQIFSEVMEGFEAGRLEPLPTTIYPAAKAEEAFRLMAQAGHVGKIVLDYAAQNVPVRQNTERFDIRGDAAYLVTGGTAGFGASVALWLAEKGAGKIILASRTGIVAEAANPSLARLAALGEQVEAVSLDVTDADAVDAFLVSLRERGAVLGGVFHAAAILADGMLAQLTPDSVDAVLGPKIKGAWNLHAATMRHGLDPEIFCCFSSIAETLGSAGQANYVAANAFLEGLARHRRALGLRAQTIGWGPLGEVGMVARNTAMRGYLESAGFRPLSSENALAALDLVLARDIGNLDYADIDWNRLAHLGGGTVPPRLRGLERSDGSGGQPLWAELAQIPRENRAAVIERMLAGEVGLVLKLDAGEIDMARPLAELGFDSLSSIELKNRIEARLGSTMPIGAFIGAPSIHSLTRQIVELAEERLRQGAVVAGGSIEAVPDPALANADQRRAMAYWAAHAAQWPRAVTFSGRRHPVLPVAGPLHWGRPQGLSLRLRQPPAGTGPFTDADWIEAFGKALARRAGREDILVAVKDGDGMVPVIVSPRGDSESVRRQIGLGQRHAGFDPAVLPGGTDADWNGAWPAQFGFYGLNARLAMPGHDLAAALAESDGDGRRLVLAYDSATLAPAFVRALAKAMLAELPHQWDGKFRPITIDADIPEARPAPEHPRPVPGDSGNGPPLPAASAELLDLIDSPAASERFRRAWTLSQAIRVAPGLNAGQLQRAVTTLVGRHESLRLRFSGERGSRRPVIGPDDACKVIVHDCRQAPPDDFLSVVRALADSALLPGMASLFEVHLLQFAGFDVVLVKVFEPIADGWSLALVCDQMIRAYLGLDLGPPPPSLAMAQAIIARRAVHEEQAPDVPPPIPWAAIGRPPQGDEPISPCTLGDGGQVSVRLSRHQTRSLRRAARRLSTTDNGLLAAAFAKALALSGAVDDVLLHVVHPGRPSPELETFVGFARQASIVAARDLRQSALGSVARSLSDQFLAAADAGTSCPELAGSRRMPDGTLAAQAFPARFGFARLLADRTLDSTLMRTLVDHRDSAIAAFSFTVEPLDLGLFGLQENQLQLRPLSRSGGIELFFFFDCEVFSREEVRAIADGVIRQLAAIEREQAEGPGRAIAAPAGQGRSRT